MKDVRPTSGRVLSALFSILGERVAGARFLDLFAGTGRVGLEALERGAAECVFVESVKARAEELRQRLGGVRLSGGRAGGTAARACAAARSGGSSGREGMPNGQQCLVLSLEVRRAISWLSKRRMTFDVIFADPPYCEGWCEALPAVPNIAALLADEAVFVVEHSVREKMDYAPGFEILSVREYGETCLTFLTRRRTQE